MIPLIAVYCRLIQTIIHKPLDGPERVLTSLESRFGVLAREASLLLQSLGWLRVDPEEISTLQAH